MHSGLYLFAHKFDSHCYLPARTFCPAKHTIPVEYNSGDPYQHVKTKLNEVEPETQFDPEGHKLDINAVSSRGVMACLMFVPLVPACLMTAEKMSARLCLRHAGMVPFPSR
jgi:hypothetical protein